MRLLTARALEQTLPMRECIHALEAGMRRFPSEHLIMPPRLVVPWPEQAAVWLVMPVLSYDRKLFAVKIISEYRQNPARYGLPTGSGLVLLADGRNGQFLGVCDARTLTARRTGGLGGLSAQYLARPDSRTVGLLGSGEQARTQLEAVCAVRRIRKVRVYSTNPGRRARFAREMRARVRADIQPVPEARAAVQGADILVTATNSAVPVVDGRWLAPGVHVISVGALPDRRELDPETFKRADVVVADLKEAVMREAGDVIHALEHGLLTADRIAELHEVITRRTPSRRARSQITVFKSVGFAFLDLVAAQRSHEIAEFRSLGRTIAL